VEIIAVLCEASREPCTLKKYWEHRKSGRENENRFALNNKYIVDIMYNNNSYIVTIITLEILGQNYRKYLARIYFLKNKNKMSASGVPTRVVSGALNMMRDYTTSEPHIRNIV
jgi:hypothetical protein